MPIGLYELAIVVPLVLGGLVAAWFGLRSRSALPDPKERVPIGERADAAPATDKVEALAPEPPSALDRFRAGFARTSSKLAGLFGGATVDDSLFESLEEALIGADVGVKTAMALVEELRETARSGGIEEPEALREALRVNLRSRLARFSPELLPPPAEGPHVLLVVGVNGSGKTTSIGKLANRFKGEGRQVLLGAGDTFRAGAIEQLKVWSDRAQVDIIAHQEGADPAAVLFDTLEAAKARGHDTVLCDTAGRLQSKQPLMEELGKVTRVIGKACPGAPHEVLLVLDGTMGQNALSQARTFGEVTGVTGVVLTKLDGTAKGGVVIAIMEELAMPVKFVGIGEGIDDLRPFDADAFVDALL